MARKLRTCGMCGKKERIDKLSFSNFVSALGSFCLDCITRAMKAVTREERTCGS